MTTYRIVFVNSQGMQATETVFEKNVARMEKNLREHGCKILKTVKQESCGRR